jgi:hypothetical protein
MTLHEGRLFAKMGTPVTSRARTELLELLIVAGQKRALVVGGSAVGVIEADLAVRADPGTEVEQPTPENGIPGSRDGVAIESANLATVGCVTHHESPGLEERVRRFADEVTPLLS